MKNAVVTAADSRYLPAACCALLSCAGEGAVGDDTMLFLLAIGASATELDNARRFFERHSVFADVVGIAVGRVQPFRADGYVSPATYARLLLCDQFDDRWDRLLFLDADTRVRVPLQPLFDTDLAGSPLGAVHDYVQYLVFGINNSRCRLSLTANAPYFNAGVLLFDWPVALQSGLLQRARTFAEEFAHLCKMHDQDALNVAFEGTWVPLDPRWNLLISAIPKEVFRLDYPERIRSNIAHFAGPAKPWMLNFPDRDETHRAWYWSLCQHSAWPNFAVPPAGAWKRVSRDGKPNPQLERLLDIAIAEAAGSGPARAALSELLETQLVSSDGP
jgi:lipopolysaccharide biosynthesis glycosyltransferase